MKSRRLTSVLLVMLMLLTMLPVPTASAYMYGEDWTCPICGSSSFDPDGDSVYPTCTQPGRLCGYCGECYDRTEGANDGYVEGNVPALGHNWSPWYTEDPATCTKGGKEVRYCQRCQISEHRDTPANGHQWGDWIGSDETSPTCTEPGKEHRYCDNCEEGYEERDVPALGHDWGESRITKEPTCTENGYKEYTCDRCGITGGEPIPALGHAYGDWKVTKQPTCTEEGEQQSKCSRCGKTLTEKIPALGHAFGEWTVTKQPTCTEEGEKQSKCSRCGKTLTEKIPPLGHNHGEWKTVEEPTCIKEGTRESVCSRCGDTIYDGIPTTDHKWGSWHVIQEPTDFACGYEQRECQVCNTPQKRPIYPEGAIKNGDRGDDVKKLQEELNDQGYDCGKADGIAGGNTENAIEEWQKDHGYTPDGVWYPGYWTINPNPVPGPTPFHDEQPAIQLEAAVTGYDPNQGVRIDFTITNTGNVDLTHWTFNILNFETEEISKLNNIYRNMGAENPLPVGGIVTQTFWMVPSEAEIAMGVFPFKAQAESYEIVDGKPDYDDPVYSNIVPLRAVFEPIESAEPYPDLLLEVVSVSATQAGFGDTVEIELKATNTGTAYLYIPYTRFTFEDGTSALSSDGDSFHNSKGILTNTPGETVTITYNLKVQQKDLDYGYIHRDFTVLYQPWLNNDDDTIAGPENDHSVYVLYPDSVCLDSNTVSVDLKLPGEGEYWPSIDLSGSAKTYIVYSAGDIINIDLELWNSGNTDLDKTGVNFGVYDPDDNLMTDGGWLVVGEDNAYLAPDGTRDTAMTHIVTAEEAALGSITFAFSPEAVEPEKGTPVSGSDIYFTFRLGGNGPVPDPDPDPDPNTDPEYKLVLAVDEIDPLKSEYQDGDPVTFRWTVMNLSNVDLAFGGIIRFSDPATAYKGGSENQFVLGDSNVILTAGGGFVSSETTIYLDDAQAIDDVIHSVFEAYGWDVNNGDEVCSSNQVHLIDPLGDDNPTGWEIPPVTDVEVIKSFSGVPSSVYGFMEGDVITYDITVTNICDETITDIEVTDPLKGENEDALVATILSLDPAASATVSFPHTVTADDVATGFIKNTACATWIDADSNTPVTRKSNQVIVPTVPGVAYTPDITLVKSVAGDPPKNGTFFTEGETVVFGFALTNNTDADFTNVAISDILVPGSDKTIAVLPTLPAHATGTFEYSYTVTPLDAILGHVTNTAAGTAIDVNGDPVSYISNDVTVITGIDKPTDPKDPKDPEGSTPVDPKDPFGVITDLEITKAELSTPANGSFYQEGETIKYVITVENSGESMIDEVLVYDTLREPIGTELASIESFYPGSMRSYIFEYTVTAEDVAKGYVVNYATAIFYMGMYSDFRIAGPVISDTDGNPDDFIDEKPGFDTPITLDGDSGEYIPCKRILDAHGYGESDYTLHTCTIHQPTADKVASLVNAAKTDAEKLDAWKQAQELWTAEIDKIYDACFKAANNVTAMTAIINEKAMFYAQLNVYKAALALEYDEITVEMKIAEALMNRCTDFCYEIHTAPEARVDSLLGSFQMLNDAEPAENCKREILSAEGSDVKYAEKLCKEHADIQALIDNAINDSKTKIEDAFDHSINLWRGELDTDTNVRYKAADKEQRGIIAADRMTFDSWLTAREAFLDMLYGDQIDKAEVYCKTIMNRVIDYCEAEAE